MLNTVDFLLIGGGISGHILQYELENRGFSTLVYNKEGNNISTSVAAGIVNPVTGKFFTLTWRAADVFNYLEMFYRKAEHEIGETLFYQKTINRVFTSAGEQNIWLSKSNKARFKPFCDFKHKTINGLQTPFGILEIFKGGSVDIKPLINYCKMKYNVKDEQFNWTQVNFKQETYNGTGFKNIIACEGIELLNNPLFSLPLIKNKGELIKIHCPGLELNEIITAGVFIRPLGDDYYLVGATYENEFESISPTAKMLAEIRRRLDKVLELEYSVVDHFAGIRPTVEDRRPLLGRHVEHENVWIFNGMGSKAYSLAPLLSKELVDSILNDAPLHSEINYSRFC